MRDSNHSIYYWKSTPVANTAQLLTLFCRSCDLAQSAAASSSPANKQQFDIPLVAILRDTLGDKNPENDRVSYVWLLTYSHPNLEQRALSAIPFFYWRIGQGSSSATRRDTVPLFDFSAPEHPVMSEFERDLLQWTMLDPMITPVRATSRAYRTNQLDDERLHLAEAIGYLRQAPVADDETALTRTQLDTVIARLELRKRLLGGLVTQRRAVHIGAEAGFEQERIRSRNWELLRQCAEKTGLVFEPLDLAGTHGEYAMLWFPVHQAAIPTGTSLHSVWKLLNIRNPWSDERFRNWTGPVYTRAFDENGSLLPRDETGVTQLQLVPLAVYSLNYPKLPLLLVDFRDKLHVRWHEMTQRSINEVTAGVIGISHFTNWYYYVAADLYDFVVARHGAAMNQAARLDSYSQFRVSLALDRQIDPGLRREMQRRVESLALNPLEAAPVREMAAACGRYALLKAEAGPDGALENRLEKQRRAELAHFEESKKVRTAEEFAHALTFGAYTHRAKHDFGNLAALDAYRRVESQLQLLDSLAEAGTQPEVAYDSSRIQSSIAEVSDLLQFIDSPDMRAHATATLERLKHLSRDEQLQAQCTIALVALKGIPAAISTFASGIAAPPHAIPVTGWQPASSPK